VEPSMSEIHDNNHQIRPANQNMMSQLTEILSAIPTQEGPHLVHAAPGFHGA
jgi:hypothetical protein